jgi:carboxylesterase type B
MSEDCLILDVLVPSKPVSSNLPVLLQIHGGGYVSGSAQTPGDGLVNASNGQIMYVSIQYRLGMFGFLAGTFCRGEVIIKYLICLMQALRSWLMASRMLVFSISGRHWR